MIILMPIQKKPFLIGLTFSLTFNEWLEKLKKFNGFLEYKIKNGVNVYGAIWTTGANGEPILKSVAKLNKEGVLELL